jgi:hypothetical protein
MHTPDLIERLMLGAASGLAGTLLLQMIRTANQQLSPESMPPIREDPGEFMVEHIEDALPATVWDDIPTFVETATARSLALGYGMTAGAIYAALRPTGGSLLVDGAAVGLGTWAAGYLGWMPALDLMPPVQKQNIAQVAGPVAQHLVFGLVVVAIYRWLQRPTPVGPRGVQQRALSHHVAWV